MTLYQTATSLSFGMCPIKAHAFLNRIQNLNMNHQVNDFLRCCLQQVIVNHNFFLFKLTNEICLLHINFFIIDILSIYNDERRWFCKSVM